MSTSTHWNEDREPATIIAGMVGRTFVDIHGRVGDEEMVFIDDRGGRVTFFHHQDCCESVAIEEIVGDLTDLLYSPVQLAEEVSSEDAAPPEYHDSYTWTFYKFATVKGAVTVRWLGRSNGYYSESVCVSEESASCE